MVEDEKWIKRVVWGLGLIGVLGLWLLVDRADQERKDRVESLPWMTPEMIEAMNTHHHDAE